MELPAPAMEVPTRNVNAAFVANVTSTGRAASAAPAAPPRRSPIGDAMDMEVINPEEGIRVLGEDAPPVCQVDIETGDSAPVKGPAGPLAAMFDEGASAKKADSDRLRELGAEMQESFTLMCRPSFGGDGGTKYQKIVDDYEESWTYKACLLKVLKHRLKPGSIKKPIIPGNNAQEKQALEEQEFALEPGATKAAWRMFTWDMTDQGLVICIKCLRSEGGTFEKSCFFGDDSASFCTHYGSADCCATMKYTYEPAKTKAGGVSWQPSKTTATTKKNSWEGEDYVRLKPFPNLAEGATKLHFEWHMGSLLAPPSWWLHQTWKSLPKPLPQHLPSTPITKDTVDALIKKQNQHKNMMAHLEGRISRVKADNAAATKLAKELAKATSAITDKANAESAAARLCTQEEDDEEYD
jgi:hypothetical protein